MRLTLTIISEPLSSTSTALCLSVDFFMGLGFGTLGRGFPLALARSIFLRRRSSSADRGAGVRLVTDAEKTDPSGSEDTQRSMVCFRLVSKVEMLVTVELPLGRRTRNSSDEVGSGVVDWRKSRLGGVHDSRLYLRDFGS